MWVLVKYRQKDETKIYIGMVISKQYDYVLVRCLEKAWKNHNPQKFERDACHYQTVYKTDIIPQEQGGSTGRNRYWTY